MAISRKLFEKHRIPVPEAITEIGGVEFIDPLTREFVFIAKNGKQFERGLSQHPGCELRFIPLLETQLSLNSL